MSESDEIGLSDGIRGGSTVAAGIPGSQGIGGSGAALEDRHASLRVFRMGMASVGFVTLGISALVAAANLPAIPEAPAIIVFMASGPAAIVFGGIALHRYRSLRARPPKLFVGGVAFFGVFLGVLMAGAGFLLSLAALGFFGRGRQIRSFGRLLLPPVVRGNAWSRTVSVKPDICADADASTRAAMAMQWRENGRTEHASVAAFAELTRDLMALGAPPALLVSAQEDALDEIRHTEICFAIARALDGKDESPGAFPAARRNRMTLPSREMSLATLAVDSLIDGAVHEGMSARMLARVVKRCEDRAVQALVKEITADEGRHSTHGWDVVKWCLEEGGETVQRALQGAMAAMPETSRSQAPEGAKDGSWERYGLAGDALHEEEFVHTRHDVRQRIAGMSAAFEGRRSLAA